LEIPVQIIVNKNMEMAGPTLKRSVLPLCFQAVIVTTLMVVLALMPAPRGPMIVLSLSHSAIKPWLDEQSGTTVLGLGRLPGSIIVSGDRDALFPVAVAHHAILLPALPALCEQSFNQREHG
jgi:hypothetical protein